VAPSSAVLPHFTGYPNGRVMIAVISLRTRETEHALLEDRVGRDGVVVMISPDVGNGPQPRRPTFFQSRR
jgi:hypothetical protein